MKIGYFTTKFPYSVAYPNYICGGSILATQSLVNEISKMGHDIKVFTSSKDSNNHLESYRNVEINRYGINMNLMSSNLSIGLFREPLKYDVDIVHTSFDIPPGPFAGLRYAQKKKVPMVVTYHGDWEENYGNVIRRFGVSIFNKWAKKILSLAKIIISPSSIYVSRSNLLGEYGEKVVVIPNGIDMDEFKIKQSKKECRKSLGLPLDNDIVLFFGNLSPYKSPDILLKALPQIMDEVPSILLIFAGLGIMMDDLKKLSVNLGVEKNVIFPGFVDKDERSFYYKSADIFCLPSTMKTESFGIVNLEAMSSGIPIIASNIGGIPDVVKDHENGLLVPPNDISALANAIIYLLKNKEKRIRMGLDGIQKAKAYSWKNIAKKTEDVYNAVINSDYQDNLFIDWRI